MGFNLQQVVPWGRSFEEYCAMFTLDEQDLQKSIVGVGDGPAAFNAVLTGQGGSIISADPIYAFISEQIGQRIDEIFDDMLVQVMNNASQLRLDKFGSAEALGQVRLQAMNRFLQDFDAGKQQGRYVDFELPVLPFNNKQFELALCSHLLFLYSEQLDLNFHIQSVLELCRIAKEVRIFPLLDLSHQPSAHLETVVQAVEQAGFIATNEVVDYEFQVGANQMLRIKSLPLS
ncbi:SAM-dependent methyltransferase [Methyloprofundus sp.]|uniref:SAM-dependent methyltransferase n=1 Tax=Methyloprofundus sp. TaxID=2020875 RepID=UPI003D12F5D7